MERIITTSVLVIDKFLTVLKGLPHLLENQKPVCGVAEQGHGFLASIPIQLTFNINSPSELWTPWTKGNRAVWWLCISSTDLPLDCFQTPRNVQHVLHHRSVPEMKIKINIQNIDTQISNLNVNVMHTALCHNMQVWECRANSNNDLHSLSWNMDP